MRFIFLGLIQLYRYCISPFFPGCCRFHPTCSSYAKEAITTHGALKGGWHTFTRLLRCHPFGGMGYDPVTPPSHEHVKHLHETHRP